MKLFGLVLFFLSLSGFAWAREVPPHCDLPSPNSEVVTVFLLAKNEGGGMTAVQLNAGSALEVSAFKSMNWIFVYVPCASDTVKTGVVAVKTIKNTCSAVSYDFNKVKLYRSGVFYNNGWPSSDEFDGQISFIDYQSYYINYGNTTGSGRVSNDLDRFHWCYRHARNACLDEPEQRKTMFQYEKQADRTAKMTSMYRVECNGGTWVPFWFGGDPIDKMQSVIIELYVVLEGKCVGEFKTSITQRATLNCP